MMPTMQLSVATTIYNQLGGNKFVVMTGARSFIQGSDQDGMVKPYLAFRLPSGKFNFVKIELNPNDLYDVTFWKLRGNTITKSTTINDVYVEQLRSTVEQHTGLALSL